jgi:hypothetical protein
MLLPVRLQVSTLSVSGPHGAALAEALSAIEALGEETWEAAIVGLGTSHLGLMMRGPSEPHAHDPAWKHNPLPDGTTEYYAKLPATPDTRDTAARVLRAIRLLLDSRRRGKYRTSGH